MIAPVLMLAAAHVMPVAAPAACAGPGKLPPELAGWATPRRLTAATTQAELGLATLPVGVGVRAMLAPTPRVAYAVPPEHAGGAITLGGLFAFTVTQGGTYRVALSGPAWIDLIADGRTMASSAHGHGPDCTGIRKQVDFALTPGRYVLQIAGASDPALTRMVARLPV